MNYFKFIMRSIVYIMIVGLISCGTNSGVVKVTSVIDVNVPDSKKKVLSVMKFDDRSIKTKDFAPWGMGIAEMMMESLGAIPYYKVISREHLVKDILKEQEFQLLGATDQESAVKLGSLLNAQYIVVGSFSVFNDTLTINAKVISVETGQVIVQTSSKGSVEEFYTCQNQVAIKLAQGMNLYLSPEAQKKLLDRYETRVVDASLENYKGVEKMEEINMLKKMGEDEKAKEKAKEAKKDFKKALEYDAKYEKPKRNLSKLALILPMTL